MCFNFDLGTAQSNANKETIQTLQIFLRAKNILSNKEQFEKHVSRYIVLNPQLFLSGQKTFHRSHVAYSWKAEFTNIQIRCRIWWMCVDRSHIRKEKVAGSKISGHVWTWP